MQQPITPQPVEQQVVVGEARDNEGNAYVVMQISGPVGTHVSFLSLAAAEEIAGRLEAQAQKLRTGLVVATNLQVLNGARA